MLRRLLALLVFTVSAVSLGAQAVAQEDTDAPDKTTTDSPTAGEGESPKAFPVAPRPPSLGDDEASQKAQVRVAGQSIEAQSEGLLEGWKTEIHGYFRAPMAIGISSRTNPDEMNRIDPNDASRKLPDGPQHLQLAYAPNRIMDWSYYSFAYTGLQEQDWAEFFIHQKKRHVDAVVGWIGYWYGAAGYRNPDASWWPGMAYLTLDTDFELGGMKPKAAITMGSFWPQFGYVEKYDTFTLGRFRMMGEQATLELPITEDLTLKLFQGLGTNRNGAYDFTLNTASPLYAGKTGVDMIVYGHAQLSYKKVLDVGLHYNYTFTRDPRLHAEAGATAGQSYSDAAKAHLSVAGAEVNLRIPRFGRLWISPSYISVTNGWALAGAGGTEVMHAQNGLGIAQNYMAWAASPRDSTGSGTMMNLGFLYTLSLSEALQRTTFPEMRVSLFGLIAKAKFDLPPAQSGQTSLITRDGLTQVKVGADLTIIPKSWFSLMFRADQINYDQDTAGYVFAAFTGRLSLFSNYLSGECIYLQYSHYIYGDNMRLAGTWPWGTNLVAGSTVVQAAEYPKQKPDADVIKLQAQIRF